MPDRLNSPPAFQNIDFSCPPNSIPLPYLNILTSSIKLAAEKGLPRDENRFRALSVLGTYSLSQYREGQITTPPSVLTLLIPRAINLFVRIMIVSSIVSKEFSFENTPKGYFL